MKKMNPSAERKSQKQRETDTILLKTLIWSKSWGCLWIHLKCVEERATQLSKWRNWPSSWRSWAGFQWGRTKIQTNPSKKWGRRRRRRKNNESEEDEKASKLKPLQIHQKFSWRRDLSLPLLKKKKEQKKIKIKMETEK